MDFILVMSNWERLSSYTKKQFVDFDVTCTVPENEVLWQELHCAWNEVLLQEHQRKEAACTK